MLNKVFLEAIIAEKPKVQKAINGRDFICLIVICKTEQRRITKNNQPVPLYPDDILPVIVFNQAYVKWLSNNRNVGDVIQIEGKLKTPNRKIVILAQKIKLIKSAEYKALERELIKGIERIRNNEHNNN